LLAICKKLQVLLTMNRVSRNLTRDECAEVTTSTRAKLAGEGYSHRTVGQRFGVSQSTISRVVQRYRETGAHVRCPEPRRHRATTPAQDRYLK
jgi:transposase